MGLVGECGWDGDELGGDCSWEGGVYLDGMVRVNGGEE